MHDAIAQLIPLGGVHPAVQHDDPEGGHGGAEGDKEGGKGMDPWFHTGCAKQHDAKEGSLKEKGGEDFVSKQGACDVTDGFHEAGPIGAELERHGDAGHNAHGKGQGKDLDPEHVGIHPLGITGGVEAQLEEQKDPAKRDGNGGKQDVERDIRAKLNARKNKGVHAAVLYLA
jgi:hypothetical protein